MDKLIILFVTSVMIGAIATTVLFLLGKGVLYSLAVGFWGYGLITAVIVLVAYSLYEKRQ